MPDNNPAERPLTNEEVRCWEDKVRPEKKALLERMDEQNPKYRCPHLKRIGRHYFYCETRAKRFASSSCYNTERTPNPLNVKCCACIEPSEMQFWCLDINSHTACKDYH